MKVGDLIRYQDSHWIVQRCDPKRSRTAVLLAASGRSEEVAYDVETTGKAVVLCNPANEWPFVALKERPKLGKILQIIRLTFVAWDGSRSATPIELPLDLYQHWVPSDPMRNGGPVFFSPALNLQAGQMLMAVCERGRARILIPATFSTVSKKLASVVPTEKPVVTAYNHLLDEDDL